MKYEIGYAEDDRLICDKCKRSLLNQKYIFIEDDCGGEQLCKKCIKIGFQKILDKLNQ